MVTTKNYYQHIKKINAEKMPGLLKDLHEFVNEISDSGKNWKTYEENEQVKKTVDAYFKKLSDHKPEELGTVKLGIYHTIYTKLMKLIPGLEKRLYDSEIYEISNPEREGIMPLVLKSRRRDKNNNPVISLAHYYKQNGDAMSDPFMEIQIIPDLKMAEAIYFEQSSPPVNQYVYSEKNGKQFIDPEAKKSQNKFLNEWLDNLLKQEQFIELKPKAANKTEVKPKVENKAPSEKVSPKKAPEENTDIQKEVEKISDEVKFITRYINLAGKEKTDKQILAFITGLQGAILERRIRKTSPFASEIKFIQDSLVRVYNAMMKQKKYRIKIKDIDAAWEKKLREAALSELSMHSIGLLKRFKNLQGRKATKEKAENLFKAMQRAAYKTKKISAKDKYIDALNIAYDALNKFITGETKSIEVEVQQLNGINSLIGDEGIGYIEQGEQDLFQSIGEIVPGETFRLAGAIGEFLGDLEKNMTAITIEGDQGAGKSQLYFQMTDAFADAQMSTGIFSLEMGKSSSTVQRFRNENIKPVNNTYVRIADTVPNGIDTIKDYAKQFDVVVIDSWTKLNISSEEFDKLRRQYPNTIWVVVFQRTSGKMIRGGTRPLFDAGMNIEVVKVDDTFENNYAVATKNRYGNTGVKFNIKNKKLF